MKPEFKAGEPATIETSVPRVTDWRASGSVEISPARTDRKTLTVKRVMANFVELEDGSRWSLDDCGKYPKKDRAWGDAKQKVVPGGEAEIARRAQANDAREKLRKFSWSDAGRLSDDAAVDILARWERDIEDSKT